MAPHRLVCIIFRLLSHILVNLAFCCEYAVVIETASLQMLWLLWGGEATHNYSVMSMLLLFFVGFLRKCMHSVMFHCSVQTHCVSHV